MLLLKLVFFSIAAIVSCSASGIGHLVPAAVRTVPIVRYAPFYSFPGAVRSIHAVAPALPTVAHALPAPALPVPAPALPAIAPAPFIPAPVPGPIWPERAFPAPVLPAPVLPAPPIASAVAPVVHSAPLFTPFGPRFAPTLPAVPFAPQIRLAGPQIVPFAPHFKSFATGVTIESGLPAPVLASAVAPANFAVARSVPYSVWPFPPPAVPAPLIKQAWK